MTWDIQELSAAFAAASAIAAAAAALMNWRQSRHAAKANDVTVYLDMMKEYSSPEMRTASSDLAAFWENLSAGQTVEVAYRSLLVNNEARAVALRGQSRRLSFFYVNAARLYESRLIDRKLTKLLIDQSGLNVFYQVAVPINLVRNPSDNSARYADMLRKILPQHGRGLFKRHA